MSLPSRVLAAGSSPLLSTTICGDVGNTLTAAGSSTTDALQLAAVHNRVSTTASSTGVKLLPAEAGAIMTVANDGANTLTVYPATGSTIDGAASVSIATTKRRIFVGISPTVWVSILGA
ncbi:MAG: hypothetical protein AMJ53_08055 [Gammaproteobacteria bacterium SG8_11]|nr:MAG: hypothetical protein AMJ53_08055 [Gammaproteobacteria bacterium SG8_11]